MLSPHKNKELHWACEFIGKKTYGSALTGAKNLIVDIQHTYVIKFIQRFTIPEINDTKVHTPDDLCYYEQGNPIYSSNT